MVFAGIATHYCEYARLGELEAALVHCSNVTEIKDTLRRFCPDEPTASFSLEPYRAKIKECFSGKSVACILATLIADNSNWSRKVLKVCFNNCIKM